MLRRETAAFVVVGSIGFLVDAGGLAILFHVLDWGHYTSRVISFGLAVTVTWILNRTWTFAHRATSRPGREYLTYVSVASLGAAINFAIYAACIATSTVMAGHPVLALACGSLGAMVFNFFASRRFAFTGTEPSGFEGRNSGAAASSIVQPVKPEATTTSGQAPIT